MIAQWFQSVRMANWGLSTCHWAQIQGRIRLKTPCLHEPTDILQNWKFSSKATPNLSVGSLSDLPETEGSKAGTGNEPKSISLANFQVWNTWEDSVPSSLGLTVQASPGRQLYEWEQLYKMSTLILTGEEVAISKLQMHHHRATWSLLLSLLSKIKCNNYIWGIFL